MKFVLLLAFYIFTANAQQTIDKVNVNQLKLPKESLNRALILDGAGQVKSSSTVTDTEIGYLEGLSDTLVNLLSGKANDSDVVKLTGDQSVDGIKTFTGKLVAQSTVNGSTPCPVMTEAQRNLFTPVEGDCVYNSDTLKLNVFDGSIWKDVGGAGGISLWITLNPYIVNDIVIESDKIYRCVTAHTSDTFAADFILGYWVEVSQGLTSPVSLADGGTGSSITPFIGSLVYVDSDSFEQLIPGTPGQILQIDGSSLPSWTDKTEYSVTNSLETTLSTTQVLLETGNKNILTNPSFESSSFDSGGWINLAGSFTENFANKIDGEKSARLVLSSQTMSLTQSSVLYQSSFADGVQGLASVRVKSDVSLKVCSVQAGIVSTSNCVDVQPNNKWGLYKVPFILGATSNGISIASTGAVSGTVYIDDAFVGSVDLSADVDSSKVAGEAYFSGAANCAGWTRTSNTIGAVTADADCPGPTIVTSSMGSWQTTDSDLPRVTINNLPPGTYKAKFYAKAVLAIGGQFSAAINDGNSTCYAVAGPNGGLGQYTPLIVECTFSYASSGNRVFELYVGSTANTITLVNDTTLPAQGTKFILEYFGSGSVYTSTNADTDWASCGHTTSDFTGFGTVTNIETQCKREGSDLLMRGKFTSGSDSAVEARLALKLGGTALTSASSPTIASLQVAGHGNVSTASTTFFSGVSILIEPSVGYVTFGRESSTTDGTTKTNANNIATVGRIISINARIPIAGWTNSNIIIGQFNGLESCASTLECTDTFSAKVSSAGVVSDENVDWINGSCSYSLGSWSCNFSSSIFTVSPNCTASSQVNRFVRVNAATSSAVSGITYNDAGVSDNQAFQIICQKQGADYIGKTAKAVAGDQNVRTPGIIKAVHYSSKISSAGVVSAELGEFITGDCTVTSIGIYTCTVPSNTFLTTPNCTSAANDDGRVVNYNYSSSTPTSLVFRSLNFSNALTGVSFAIQCHGVSP